MPLSQTPVEAGGEGGWRVISRGHWAEGHAGRRTAHPGLTTQPCISRTPGDEDAIEWHGQLGMPWLNRPPLHYLLGALGRGTCGPEARAPKPRPAHPELKRWLTPEMQLPPRGQHKKAAEANCPIGRIDLERDGRGWRRVFRSQNLDQWPPAKISTGWWITKRSTVFR